MGFTGNKQINECLNKHDALSALRNGRLHPISPKLCIYLVFVIVCYTFLNCDDCVLKPPSEHSMHISFLCAKTVLFFRAEDFHRKIKKKNHLIKENVCFILYTLRDNHLLALGSFLLSSLSTGSKIYTNEKQNISV